MHSSISEGRLVLLLLNGRIASWSLRISRSSPSRWSKKIRLSSVHTTVSLSLNADEILDLSTLVWGSFSAFRTARNKKRSMPRDTDIVLKLTVYVRISSGISWMSCMGHSRSGAAKIPMCFTWTAFLFLSETWPKHWPVSFIFMPASYKTCPPYPAGIVYSLPIGPKTFRLTALTFRSHMRRTVKLSL